VRATLLRLAAEEHILLLGMHHIISDGWSMAVLFRELSTLYDAYANGKASPLPELAIQYADYAVWQRNWLQGEVLAKQLSHWRKQLENISPLQLATDRPRPAVQTFHGARASLLLSKDLTQALKALSRKQGSSLFMTLLAGLQILLCRLSGQDDIAVGSPIAGRNRAEVESLIGFFLNTLVLRTNLSGDATFLQVLEKVRGVCLEAYAHQDVPFEKIIAELRPERDLSRTPFFQVFLNMVNVPERVRPAGLNIEALSHAEVESKFDLTIYARERDGNLHLNWVYNADLFDRERMQEMTGQYEALLADIVRDPGKGVHSYSLLTPAARKVLPDPAEPLASDWAGSVHGKLSQHASSFPDHVAINDPHGDWTYAELNARSNRLANYLLAGGIQREDVIAVYAHRSAALPWAVLGILKAGAAFLILDPAYPAARLIQYVRSAQPRGLISLEAAGAVPTDLEQVLQETIRCRIGLPRISELGAWNLLENYSAADPQIEILPEDLAYISYTSGSTGEPKGVQGTHGPLSHFLPWQTAHFGLTSADRFSLLSGLSHDPLHREILTCVWIGATLCIPNADLLSASGELPAWMDRQRVTFAHLTPALGRLLAESAKPDSKLGSLRYAFCVGDKLTRNDIARLRSLAPHATVINYYGSTETQRAVSYYEIPPHAQAESGENIVPVGRGMPDAQLLVLTQAQVLAGIGEVGEIYMRSPHLARGYLNDPSLTRARFVTNPFTGQAQDRMYQTGDLGRYLGDGSVEVLGRTDGQINIRGFRVETGEIEFVLSKHASVRDVVVIAREDTAGDKRLVAYVVGAQEPALDIHELRSFLRQRMPDHMIPAAFVLLNSLPLTPNGKLDRRALPAPDYSRQEQRAAAAAAPRGELELQLAQIWEKLLKVRSIGIKDNFFDLGGHSLLAVRLFAQIEKATGKSLPVAALFHAPTIEQLAGLINEQGWAAQWKSLVAIQPGGSKPPLFCVHAHDGGVLFWRDLARHLGPDQPFYALQPQGLDGEQPLHTRIEDMAAHYVKEMRRLQPEGPYFIGGHCIGGLMAFEMAQQLHSQGERVAFLALIDSFAPRPQGSAPSSLLRRYRYRAIRLFERTVTLHFGNLAFLEHRERLPYLKEKINKALYKLYMAAGLLWIPAARTRQRILKAGSEAARHYNPKSYSAKITLFRATELGGGVAHDRHMGWGRLAAGELEAHLIPGYHAHIVLEPRVRLLAQELSVCLERAREACEQEQAGAGEPVREENRAGLR
jgi:amino acid adenylation domain-containing protein